MRRESLIRIGYLIDTIGESPGGTETQLLALIRNIDRTRFQPFLYVLRRSDLIRRSDLCPLHEMGVGSLRSPLSVPKLHALVGLWRTHGIDILQTQFRESNQIGVLLARLAGIRTVVTTRRNQGHWLEKTELRCQRAINRLTRLIIANSVNTRNWVMDVEGVPEEKIRVIYNAIDVDTYVSVESGTRTRLRAKLGIDPLAPVVGIIANLRPVKCIGTFLRAASAFSALVPTARFLVIGEGDEDGEESRLIELSSELGLVDRILFLGRRKDIPDLLSIMNVGVLSSRSESMPNAIGEYMASGLPVVSTRVGGVAELVEDGVDGYLVPIDDSEAMARRILDVFAAPHKFHAARSREKIRRLCEPREIVRQFQDIYQELAS
jgi:glycosyltransferase involved in cell wall biosynthesis